MVMNLINCWLSLHVLSPEIKVEKTMETCLSQPPTAGDGLCVKLSTRNFDLERTYKVGILS